MPKEKIRSRRTGDGVGAMSLRQGNEKRSSASQKKKTNGSNIGEKTPTKANSIMGPALLIPRRRELYNSCRRVRQRQIKSDQEKVRLREGVLLKKPRFVKALGICTMRNVCDGCLQALKSKEKAGGWGGGGGGPT